MIDPLVTWQSTFYTIPIVSTGIWSTNFAAWTYGRVVDPRVTGVSTAATPFVFQESTFKGQLDTCVVQATALGGITQFANAWEAAVVASKTLFVSPGDYVEPISLPGTRWSSINTKEINAPSIAAGKAIIMTLVSAPPVPIVSMSQFPQVFRDAFLALRADIKGFDELSNPLEVLDAPIY